MNADNEIRYALYVKRAKAADELYKTIRDLYGDERPWKQVYMLAIRDKVLSEDEKNLLCEFHPW